MQKYFNRKTLLFYLPLLVLLCFASIEFVLLLRHKSPYMSDSYFYQHIYYQMQGDSYTLAHDKILKKLDTDKLSDIEKNLFFNPDKYKYALSRYTRRPFYPFVAMLINYLVNNEYLAFMIPVFLSYLGCIFLTYLLFKFRFDAFWSTLGTLLFMGFYPYLDWSTYFLTDTIGAFFWMLQIFLLIKYLVQPKQSVLIIYILSLIISLLVREQSILMFLVVGLVFFGTKLFKLQKNIMLIIKKPLIATLGIVVLFFLVNIIFKFPSLYDSWIYLQSNFGYKKLDYPLPETAQFLTIEFVRLHQGLVIELVRHRWWLIFTVLGFIGVFQLFFKNKKIKPIDLLMLASSVSSYIGLVIIPYLTYRYFFPTVIGVIYFGLYTVNGFFYNRIRK